MTLSIPVVTVCSWTTACFRQDVNTMCTEGAFLRAESLITRTRLQTTNRQGCLQWHSNRCPSPLLYSSGMFTASCGTRPDHGVLTVRSDVSSQDMLKYSCEEGHTVTGLVGGSSTFERCCEGSGNLQYVVSSVETCQPRLGAMCPAAKSCKRRRP